MVVQEAELVDTALDLLDRPDADAAARADLVHLGRLRDEPLMGDLDSILRGRLLGHDGRREALGVSRSPEAAVEVPRFGPAVRNHPNERPVAAEGVVQRQSYEGGRRSLVRLDAGEVTGVEVSSASNFAQ
jgi:hypothetical protein